MNRRRAQGAARLIAAMCALSVAAVLGGCADEASTPLSESARPPSATPTTSDEPTKQAAREPSRAEPRASAPAAKPEVAGATSPARPATAAKPAGDPSARSEPLPPRGRKRAAVGALRPDAPAPDASATTGPRTPRTPDVLAPRPVQPAPEKSTGAATEPRSASAVGVTPPYRSVANKQNARAKRLERLWARAVVSITYTDDDGAERWEQGEGHFQVIQPSRMALSVGKLGEVFLWIGCDEERYWLIDPKETKRAYVGRHDMVTREKIESLGLPVPPRDLIALAGITPVPAGGGARDPRLVRESDATFTFDQRRDGGVWRTRVDAATLDPVGIDIVSDAGDVVVEAVLERYREVKLRGEVGFFPQVASKMRLVHLPTNSSMTLTLTDASDGGKNRLVPQAFEFESLIDLLGVGEVVDLDEER